MTNQCIGYAWAPELLRCPWSQMTPDVHEVLTQWEDWRVLRSVPPFGSEVDAWPAYVAQGIKLCESEHRQAMAERDVKEAERWQKK